MAIWFVKVAGKRPVRDAYDNASTERPENAGVYLDKSNLAVIDVDEMNSEVEGWLAFHKNFVKTPRGYHLYFHLTDQDLWNYCKANWKGIDILFYGKSFAKWYGEFTPMEASTEEFLAYVKELTGKELRRRRKKLESNNLVITGVNTEVKIKPEHYKEFLSYQKYGELENENNIRGDCPNCGKGKNNRALSIMESLIKSFCTSCPAMLYVLYNNGFNITM